jgi:hypothetical protein
MDGLCHGHHAMPKRSNRSDSGFASTSESDSRIFRVSRAILTAEQAIEIYNLRLKSDSEQDSPPPGRQRGRGSGRAGRMGRAPDRRGGG